MAKATTEDVERFEERYAVSGAEAMLAAEREALGSDHQANGYTTMEQAIELGDRLRLREGEVLLDAGAGCGWPGIFIAARHRCSVISLDPVSGGVVAAHRRAAADGLSTLVWPIQASADALPIRSRSVDAVVHTDLMC